MPLLIVACEESKLFQRFMVREERFTIGRSRSAAIPIRDTSVSKVHLVISRTPAGYTFQDLWSQNGTFLNEERRDTGLLKDGDIIRVGRVKITFQDDGPVPQPSSRPERPPIRARRAPISLAGGWKRALAFLFLAAAGIGLGLGAGKLGSFLFPGPAGSAPAGSTTAGGPQSSSASVETLPAATEEDQLAADPAADIRAGESEGEKVAAAYLADLRRPYANSAESRRVLFRLSLDLLGRPPTRAEAREWLPLSHAERWLKVSALGTRPIRDLASAFQRLLGHPPGEVERRALSPGLLARACGSDPVPDLGLLLTASAEYRSPSAQRERTVRQRAGSLIVDLLDRAPREGEATDVESALEEYPGGARIARVLGWTPEATAALPALPAGEADASRAFLLEEFQRFLSRAPSETEEKSLQKELARGQEGARWIRIALAGSTAYRSY